MFFVKNYCIVPSKKQEHCMTSRKFMFFSRMCSAGFSFYIWWFGGGDMFAGRRFGVRNCSQQSTTVRNRPRATDVAENVRCLWEVLQEGSFLEGSRVA